MTGRSVRRRRTRFNGCSFAVGFSAGGRIDERSQREARYFRRAVDANSQPERAQAAIGVDVKIFVAIQARVKFLADAQDRFERRSVERNSHDAAVSVAREHHARPQMTRVQRGVGIVREDDRAVVAVDVAERARRLGAPRPQIVDADDHQFLVAHEQPAAVVGEHVGAGALERFGDPLGRRPVIVIAENREQPGLGAQMFQRVAKRTEIAMHRVGAGKIIAGEKNEVGLLLIDSFDRERQAFEVLVAIDVEVAYLARDESAQSVGQSAHRQVQRRHLNFIDRLPPHSMQRAQRQRRLRLHAAGGRRACAAVSRRSVRQWTSDLRY